MGKQILVLGVCLVIALALLPAGFGSWRQGIEIRGHVHTGAWNTDQEASGQPSGQQP
ncbi:MAG: hypothetical protein PHU78_08775 [Heliobacteriaceae bacterium]|nr:hypothetical protein [Heliobacteriaceae bacterium]